MTRRISEHISVEGDMVAVVDAVAEGGNETVTWRGVKCWKNPLDLIIYAEIVHEVRPSLVIETGTHAGGSTLFWLDMMRLEDVGRAVVISVDLNSVPRGVLPFVGRTGGIALLRGSSTSPEILKPVQNETQHHERVLVNLDSDHSEQHVAAELAAYAPLVTPGSYLIVEDGIDDFRWDRRGPYHACIDFLALHPEFERDIHRERLGVTNCPSGFLRRRTDV